MRLPPFLTFALCFAILAPTSAQTGMAGSGKYRLGLADSQSDDGPVPVGFRAAEGGSTRNSHHSRLWRRNNGYEEYLRRQRSRRIDERREGVHRQLAREEAEAAAREQQRILRYDSRSLFGWGFEDEDERLYFYSGVTPEEQVRDLDAISVEQEERYNLCISLTVSEKSWTVTRAIHETCLRYAKEEIIYQEDIFSELGNAEDAQGDANPGQEGHRNGLQSVAGIGDFFYKTGDELKRAVSRWGLRAHNPQALGTSTRLGRYLKSPKGKLRLRPL